jgi:hypothetical protein
VIERDLVGTREPLRFVYSDADLSLGRLQLTIDQVFRPDVPLLPARPGTAGREVPSGPVILAA